jgi:hypothetical protein
MARKRQADKVGFAPILDPRSGDIEDDASSTKRRSMLSLAGSLLVEISLPKLIVAWVLLLVVPGLLLGLAPLVISSWFGMVVNKVASAFIGLWSALLFVVVVAVGWFGWRTLFRMIEKNFWALNSIVVQPGYAAAREILRHLAEKFIARTATEKARARLRAASAAVAGVIVSGLAVLVLWLVWSSAHLFGHISEVSSWKDLVPVTLANSVVLITAYFAIAALVWASPTRPWPSLAASRPSTKARSRDLNGASCTCRTFMWSASVMAFASKAGVRARAETTGSKNCWCNSKTSTPRIGWTLS